MSGVLGTPHHPHRGTRERTCKGQHLNTSVVAKGSRRDDTVLDGVGCPSTCNQSAAVPRTRSSRTHTNGQSTKHLKACAKNHGPSIRDRSRRHAGGPGIGDIIGTVIVCIEHSEEGTNDEDIGVLVENRHVGNGWTALTAAVDGDLE